MRYVYKNDKGENFDLEFPIGTQPDKTIFEGEKLERDFEAELSGKSFCLKGTDWPGQASKRKAQMTNNNKAAGKRTRDRWGEAKKAIPNYQGQECESWKEVANLASKAKE